MKYLSLLIHTLVLNFFFRLRDESWKVRLSTLLVLSHLVTNEMVKVKGQISEVALCIVDENEVLQGKKNNNEIIDSILGLK